MDVFRTVQDPGGNGFSGWQSLENPDRAAVITERGTGELYVPGKHTVRRRHRGRLAHAPALAYDATGARVVAVAAPR
ncbi:hypothetical protein AB0N07_07115 [Streptomyces sp. NPDC051172]|uniref:hypothetical protein n=1 Tax=Streptomyces sp. NPDC051172 TaxID=3155796 RepID=UPI00342362FF